MSRLLETLTDLAFGVLNFFFRLSEETTRHRHDDPATAEKKELTRLWLLSLAVAVITLLAASIVGPALGAASAGGPLASAAEALRQGLFYLVATILSLSLLCMAYFGFRLWRLERT